LSRLGTDEIPSLAIGSDPIIPGRSQSLFRRNFHRCLVLKRRLSRRAWIGLAVLLLLGLGHGLILRLLAWPLMARETSVESDWFCIRGTELGTDGYEPYDAAAAWYGKSAGRKVLLILPRMTRIVEIGAVRSFERTSRDEFSKRGVPSADIVSLHADARDIWGEVYAVNDWLKGHADAKITMACSPFNSGRLRYVLHKVAGSEGVRVGLLWLPDPETDLERWWRSRRGVKDFMYAWLELTYARMEGDQARPFPNGADSFQQEIRARIGETPR
jgi:hypothetical protein